MHAQIDKYVDNVLCYFLFKYKKNDLFNIINLIYIKHNLHKRPAGFWINELMRLSEKHLCVFENCELSQQFY